MRARPLLLLAVLLGGLLALKSLSLADGAAALFAERAYAAAVSATAPEQDAEGGDAAEAADDGEDADEAPPPPLREAARRALPSASRLGLERNLAERRRELDQREQALDTREQLLVVAEQRMNERVDQLETLRDEVQGLLGQLDDRREEQIGEIVAAYLIMEPGDVAEVFTALRGSDPETLLLVAERMQGQNPRRFAGVMAELTPIVAAELTTSLRARAEALEAAIEAEARRVVGEG